MIILFIISSCQNPLSETGYSTTDLNVVSFSYKDAYTRGLVRNFMSIAPTNFDDKGFPPTCTIEPALPQGLSISSPDCVISGTPLALMSPTTYTVTALSRAGMSKASLSLSVASSAPMLTYPSHTASRMMVQITINPVTLYDNGSPITNCTVTPALLTGLTLNPNTCVISGATPDYLLYRLYTVTVTNAIGSSESTFSLSVAATPLMSFNGISGAGQISLPFRAQPSVFNTRGEPVTSCTTTPALPAGLSINQSTCVISGTPSELVSGTYTVTATNAVGSSDASILINITPYPPLVTYSMSGFLGYISVPFVATPNLYEINGAPITSCTISPTLPNGLSIDPITCVVSGIPTVSIPQGNYTITVTNSAGVGYGTLPMMILPSVPVLSYAGVSGSGSFGSYLSITPSTLVNNGAWITSCTISPALPSGLWMDNYTCSIFGTASQVIPLTTFTVSAANSAGVTTAQIPIIISPTPPNLSYEGAVGKTGLAQSPRTIIPRTFNYGGVSITNCTISPALPTGLSIAPTTCVISGTALYESTTTTYTVTATNVAGTGTATLDISVSPIPPTLSYSSSSGKNGLAQNAMSITPSALNQGGTTITNCTITPNLPPGSNGNNGQWDLPFGGLTIHPTTCVISGTSPYESPLTTYTVTIHNSAGTGTATVALKVDPIPPTLSYAGATGTVGKMEDAMSISPTALNKGGTTITNCTTSPALPSGLSINTSTCVVSGTPVGMSDQNYVITIHNSSGTGTANLRIVVGPNLPILSYSGTTGTNGQWDVAFSASPTSLRVRGSNLSSCSITPALPTGLSIDQSTCVISGIPKAILSSTVFTITPTNIVGSGTPATVTLSLIPNIPILSYSGSTGTSGQWDVSMSVSPTTRDTRGASITTCSITPSLPTGLSINQSTCVISGIPTVTLASTTFTITPQNSAGNGASTTVNLSVAPNTPVLSYSGSTGTYGQWDVPMSITPTTLNNRGSSVTGCSITPALPTGLTINANTCVISGTPKAILSSATFTVTATNAVGSGSSTTVTLTIIPNIPIISYSGATGTTGNAQSSRTISPTTLDTRGAGVTSCQSSPSLPDGLSFNNTTCVISGSPTTAQSATTYTITATNSAGTSSSTTVSIAVSAITPTISYTASTGNAQSSRTITPTINAGGSTVSNCTATLPAGLSIAPTTCVISGTPSTAQSATNYTVTITTAHGLSNTGTVSIAVSAINPTISYTASTGNAQSSRTITPTINAGGSTISNCTATLPAGLSIAPTTCVISGSPTTAQSATNYTVTVTNAHGLSGTGTVSIAVSAINPTISYTASTGNAQSSRTITPTVNAGGSTINNCTASLPDGLSIAPTTCVISGSPTTAQSATNYTVTVTNAHGLSGTGTVSIAVSAITPTISYTASTGNAQSSRTITPTINAGGSTVSNCTATLPAGLSIAPTTCVISGSPTTAQLATNYTVTITTAAGLSNTGTVSIAVSAINPTISYTASTGNAQSSRTVTPTINAGGSTISNCTATLPDGLSIAPTTCVISGTPSTAQSATNYTVTVTNAHGLSGTGTVSIAVSAITPTISYTASTGNAQFSRTITPTINAGGSTVSNCTATLPAGLSIAPTTCVISGSPTTAQSATNYTVTITTAAGLSNTGTVSIAVSAITPTISYTASTGNAQSSRTITPTINAGGSTVSNCTATLPAGLSIAPTTCVISGSPTTAQLAANYTVTITTAAGLSNTGTVSIAVSAINPTISYTASTGNAQSSRTVTPTINAGGSTISNCTATLPDGLSIAPTTCVISGTPSTAQSATNYTVTVTNAHGLSGTGTVSIAVSAITPTISYSASTGNAQSSRTITPTINAGGSTVSNCTATLPAGLSIAPTTCVISGSPTTAQSATNYTVTITTAAGLSSTGTVSIAVSAITPTISYSASTGNIHSSRTITPTINAGGSTVSNCTASLPAGLSIAPTTCIISGTPTASQTATNHTVTITTAHGLSNTGTVSITVSPIAPALSYASASGTVNSALTINPSNINANGAAISSCTTSGLPAGLSVNSSCVISGTPTTAGSASYTITATNSAGSTNASVTITIAAIAPTLSYSGASGTSGQVNTAMSISPTGLTTGGAPITNCTGTLPSGLSINATSCVISGTPTWAQGATNHTITITNSSNLTSTATVSITIAARLPTISFAAASTGNVGTARTITPTTYNGGTNISNCTVSPALPAGLSISTSTCLISGTPSSPAGPTTHTVTIHNSAGTGTGTISITVSGYVCTTLGYDGPSTVVTSTSSCWYSCSTRGYSGGNQNSLSSCYKDCNASNQCGGTVYYPNNCTNKTQVYQGQQCGDQLVSQTYENVCHYYWDSRSCNRFGGPTWRSTFNGCCYAYEYLDGSSCRAAFYSSGCGSYGQCGHPVPPNGMFAYGETNEYGGPCYMSSFTTWGGCSGPEGSGIWVSNTYGDNHSGTMSYPAQQVLHYCGYEYVDHYEYRCWDVYGWVCQ